MRLVSVVVPTLREDALSAALAQLGACLSAVDGYDFEIVVVDDSPDSYKAALDRDIADHQQRFGSRVLARRVDGHRTGKGGAIRDGVLASRGEIVFTMDADLPVPLPHVEQFLALCAAGDEVVVAERPFDRNASEPIRFIASRALFALQRIFVFQSSAFTDTQCGFKAYRGDLVRTFAARQIVDGGMVDIEYLYSAVRSGCRIARVAVVPNPDTRESRINVRRALLQDPVDLARIKLAGLLGKYD